MSTMHNNTYAWAERILRSFLNLIQMMLLIGLVSELVLVVSASAQSTEAANAKAGSIRGTVTDVGDDPVSDAAVVLHGPAGQRLAAVTKDDGSFAFPNVTPGIVYQINVTAEGFTERSSSVTVEPGQEEILSEVRLPILAVRRAVTVNYSSKEVAAQQLNAEEHQRVLGFIPNIYVTYEPHPEPLTANMKFHLAYKGLTHPTFFCLRGFMGRIEQAAHMTDYRLGARGYGERYGANLASGASEGLFANAILPSLLHQDPRYFYRGSGTKGSRAWHAVLAPFVCQGDNGKSQPNYSQMGGSLISAALSNT